MAVEDRHDFAALSALGGADFVAPFFRRTERRVDEAFSEIEMTACPQILGEPFEDVAQRSTGRQGRHLASPMATFSAHTASPPPPSRTPAGSRASSRHASIAPRTTSARGPPGWGAPRTRTHRSIPAPPTPAGASRLPRTVPYPTPASAAERPSPDPRARARRSNRPGPGCSTRRTSLPRRSSARRVPSNQASLPPAPTAETLPPSFRKSPGQRGEHRPGRGFPPRDDVSLRRGELHDDRSTRPT